METLKDIAVLTCNRKKSTLAAHCASDGATIKKAISKHQIDDKKA